MKKSILFLFVIGLSLMLLSCSKASQYDFSYTLSKYNYNSLMKITFDWVEGKGYVKYELDEEGYIENLILTFEVKKGFFDPSTVDKNVTLEKEDEFVEFELNDYEILGTNPEIVGCAGTLYTNQFEYVYGLQMNKAKSDVKELNESLEIYNDHHFYTVESELNALNVRITSQLGFRSDPFYFYILTPFERTAYSHEASTGIVTKKYQDAKTDTISYLTETEMIEELGLEETNSFLLPDTLSVYKEKENIFYIFGVIEDLKGSFFPEETFDDISYNAKFKMKIKIVSDDELLLDFDIFDDDIEFNFSFEYDFTKFGDIDYLFDLG